MKRTIRIGGSIQAVIATGSYQNLRPQFTWEETYEEEILSNPLNFNDAVIEKRIKELHEKSFTMLKEAEQKAIIDRIQRERKDLKFHISPKGNVLPGVTSIIGYDADFFVAPEDLIQYAAQGNIIHARVAHYIKTGKWVAPKEISDNWTDIVILTKGSLRLGVDVGDFPGFVKKHPVESMKVGERFFYDAEGYCGEPDFTGVPKFKEALEIPTMFDAKRTPDKIKNGIQLAAYCKPYQVKQAIVVPLNDKTGQGFSKPVVYTEKDLEGYFKIFKAKQKEFKKRYGI